MTPAFYYDIHIPANANPSSEFPAIFALHGKGSNEKDLFGLVEPLADQFVVISIRGHLPVGPGYQFFEIKSIGNPIREIYDDVVQKLSEFIQYASDKYPVDKSRRYLVGFSQGAILSMTLALTLGDQLKGIVALNGYIPQFVKTEYPLRSVENVSMFISHGELDQVFPLPIALETQSYFQGKVSNLNTKLYPTGHVVGLQNQQDVLDWLQNDAFVSE